MTMAPFTKYVLPILAASLHSACLPADTRPAPGRAEVTLVRDEAFTVSFVTDDGWTIQYDEFLISLGDVRVVGDECAAYSESDYMRLFDLRGAEHQKVNLLYALGECDVAFSMRPATRDVVLGDGVTAAERDRMLHLDSDEFQRDAAVSVYVEGTADDGERSLQFAWAFRNGTEYIDCEPVVFEGDESLKIEILVRGTALFAADGKASRVLFEPLAAADEDTDGNITLEELNVAPALSDEFDSLGEQLYFERVPRLPSLGNDRTCRGRRFELD